jgi:hypothetical protein
VRIPHVSRAACLAASLALSGVPQDFRNVARESGLTRIIPNGGEASKKYILETTGSGIAFIDYDNDGLLDLFVVSGAGGSNRMYHNEGKGQFRDVTATLGLQHTGWGQGVCAGDFDNDGFTDLFVTYWGANVLYRNVGGKRFEDVTAKAHLTQPRVHYNTGCAFIDYDNDGRLDLFVANYLKFDFKTTPLPGANPYCYYRDIPVSCGPRGLPFDRNILYHNEGEFFRDVSDESGISKPDANYALGVVTGDFNGDGLTDIYVACDRTPSILYINKGGGKFSDEALMRGAALDENGKALSGMGASAADYLHTGLQSLFRTNFSDELETLYRNRGKGEFEDASVESGLGRNTQYVGWGCGFLDFDNDGWPDLLLVNGHAFPEVERLKSEIRYRERAILYHNEHNKFIDVSEASGPGIMERHAARGAAFGDYDNDGAVEVAVNNQNEAPSLFKQTKRPEGHWITLRLEGKRSNRSAIGARVRLSVGDLEQTAEVRSGGSYLSQNDLRLHFGLGPRTHVDRIEVDWPGGGHQIETQLAIDRVVTITQRAAP